MVFSTGGTNRWSRFVWRFGQSSTHFRPRSILGNTSAQDLSHRSFEGRALQVQVRSTTQSRCPALGRRRSRLMARIVSNAASRRHQIGRLQLSMSRCLTLSAGHEQIVRAYPGPAEPDEGDGWKGARQRQSEKAEAVQLQGLHPDDAARPRHQPIDKEQQPLIFQSAIHNRPQR